MPYDKYGRWINAKHLFDDAEREYAEVERSYEIEAMKAAIVSLRRDSLVMQEQNMELAKLLQEARRQLGQGAGSQKRLGSGQPKRRGK